MKKKLRIICAVLIMGIIILAGCNSDTDSSYPSATDTARMTGPGMATDVNPKNLPVKKNAILGYSYYPKMKRGEMKIIRAYVSINHAASKIKDTLRTIEKIQTVEKEDSDTSTINIINNIPFYKKIKIEIDSTKDFSVKAYRPAQQVIDTLEGNLWLWQIAPLTDKSIAVITLLVDAESPDGVLENIDIREIKVNIEIDKKTFFRAAINYLGDNPKVSIPIIVGLATFIGWLIKYFLEKKKTAHKA